MARSSRLPSRYDYQLQMIEIFKNALYKLNTSLTDEKPEIPLSLTLNQNLDELVVSLKKIAVPKSEKNFRSQEYNTQVSAVAQYHLAQYYDRIGDIHQCLEYTRQACEQGNMHAIFFLAKCTTDGKYNTQLDQAAVIKLFYQLLHENNNLDLKNTALDYLNKSQPHLISAVEKYKSDIQKGQVEKKKDYVERVKSTQQDDRLHQLKNIIKEGMRRKESDMYGKLAELSNLEAIDFISALIRNEGKEIKDFLIKILPHAITQEYDNVLEKICENKFKLWFNNDWINQTALSLISVMLDQRSNIRHDLLRCTFSSISDQDLSPHAKVTLLKAITYDKNSIDIHWNIFVKIQTFIFQPAMEDDSPLNLYLKNMSEKNKSILLEAILLADIESIATKLGNTEENKILFLSLLKPLKNIFVDGISFPGIRDLNRFFEYFLPLIQEALLTPATAGRIIEDALQSIPDQKISTRLKKEIQMILSEGLVTQHSLNQLHYRVQFQRSLSPLAKNRYSGDRMDDKMLQQLLKTTLDSSEFIVLISSYISSHYRKLNVSVPNDIEIQLQVVRQNYLMTKYETSIFILRNICSTLFTQEKPELVGKIENKCHALQEINMHKNAVRRFFENCVAQLFIGQFIDLNTVNKFSKYFLGHAISSKDEVERAVISVAELNDKHLLERHEQIKKMSSTYKTRDVVSKKDSTRPFLKKKDEYAGKSGPTVLSSNRGVMTSLSPNFPDEVSTQHPIRNRLPDITTNTHDEKGYSTTHPRGAHVASISGHTYYLAAILLQYIDAHKIDPHKKMDVNHITQDVNNFIKAYISIYVSKGFHGILEVMHAFTEDRYVKQLFELRGVLIKTEFPSSVLASAFKDTQEYAKVLCLKKSVHEELVAPEPQKNKENPSTPRP